MTSEQNIKRGSGLSTSFRPPLRTVLPPLILGTATFNHQYNLDPYALKTSALVAHAILHHGIRAFDTSPYYGPAESLLGEALSQEAITSKLPRSSYRILTKAGRISEAEFDYSPASIRASVQRSLKRLRTSYLDVVYCHDVEFVEPNEVLAAVAELRRLRDSVEDGHPVGYIGISGYPLDTLRSLAALILKETGEPIDIIQSYAHFTLQNTKLAAFDVSGQPSGAEAGAEAKSETDSVTDTVMGVAGCDDYLDAVVPVVANASPLGMGLLRTVGVPVGAKGDFHPAPRGLRDAVARASAYVQQQQQQQQQQKESNNIRLEDVAIRFSLEEWLRRGAQLGCSFTLPTHAHNLVPFTSPSPSASLSGATSSSISTEIPLLSSVGEKNSSTVMKKLSLGVNVIGVSAIDELNITMAVWQSILAGLGIVDKRLAAYVTAGSAATNRKEESSSNSKVDDSDIGVSNGNGNKGNEEKWESERQRSLKCRQLTLRLADRIREEILGQEWFGYSWDSPPLKD